MHLVKHTAFVETDYLDLVATRHTTFGRVLATAFPDYPLEDSFLGVLRPRSHDVKRPRILV